MEELRLVAVGIAALLEGVSAFVSGANLNVAGVNRFECDRSPSRGIPTTYVVIKSERRPFIRWVVDFGGLEYTPMRRCQEVSTRLQQQKKLGRLRYITTGKMNGERVICTARSLNDARDRVCDTLLITLKPEDSPNEVLNQLFSIKDDKSPYMLKPYSPIGGNSERLDYIDVDAYFNPAENSIFNKR